MLPRTVESSLGRVFPRVIKGCLKLRERSPIIPRFVMVKESMMTQ